MTPVIVPISIKGGSGSGNYGHSGRPGLVGGSGGSGGGGVPITVEPDLQISHGTSGIQPSEFDADWHGVAMLEPEDGVFVGVIEEEKAMAQSVGTITIDTVENDDWMKTLPGYQDEVRIHEELAAKLGGKKKPKVRIPVVLESVEQ